eukprot:3161562-Amphidinium_carterae.1
MIVVHVLCLGPGVAGRMYEHRICPNVCVFAANVTNSLHSVIHPSCMSALCTICLAAILEPRTTLEQARVVEHAATQEKVHRARSCRAGPARKGGSPETSHHEATDRYKEQTVLGSRPVAEVFEFGRDGRKHQRGG